MTAAEEQGLQDLGNELANAEQSHWEPLCIARAFATPRRKLTLTLQGWIDLELAQSPFLEYRMPDGEDAIAQLSAAVDAFGLGLIENAKPEEAAALAEAMLEAVKDAFSMRIGMREKAAGGSIGNDGFGEWLPLLSCLICQCGMSRIDALITPVKQAFAIIAGHRHNQGWQVMDRNYRHRDLIEKEAQ